MANDDVKSDRKSERPSDEDNSAVELRSEAGVEDAANEQVDFNGGAFANLGTDRYVNAAFFAGGVLLAFLVGRMLAGVWNALAEWPAAVRAVPPLVSYAEDDRPGITTVIGAVVALVVVVSLVRKPGVRQWADEVATELYKVHWPEREVVTNGTIVVIVASLFATIYVGVLDRIWGFITNLVYGA
jgi:preprotein translocase subunit SecE